MRILHITNNYPTTKYPIFGIFVKEQVDSLINKGVECDVFFINGRESGVKAYLQGIIDLRKHIKKNKYDLFHCHHVYSAIILLLTFRFWKAKRIISYQNDPEREGGIYLFRIMHFIFNGIIIKNNDNKYWSNKTYYLPNGVDTDFFKPYDKNECLKRLKLDPNLNYVLFMDSYDRRRQKRVDRFSQIVKALQENGNPNRIEPLILTNTKRQLIPYYMNASALHLLTSDFEGSPNSVKECLACNTKVVTTPVGNVEDLIGDVKGCFISKTFDTLELVELVNKSLLINDFESRNKIFEKKLDIASIATKLESVYFKVLN
jgi:glycosyltransferase involved in cell wall biosynthesis